MKLTVLKLKLYILHDYYIIASFLESKQNRPRFLALPNFIFLFAPWNTMWHCFYPINPEARAKMAVIVNKVYCKLFLATVCSSYY